MLLLLLLLISLCDIKLFKIKKVDHITPVLRSLHWLPELILKYSHLVYKAVNDLGPKYILDLQVCYEPDQSPQVIRIKSTFFSQSQN